MTDFNFGLLPSMLTWVVYYDKSNMTGLGVGVRIEHLLALIDPQAIFYSKCISNKKKKCVAAQDSYYPLTGSVLHMPTD